MARIIKLKEKYYHDDSYYIGFKSPLYKSIDVYETREELGDEKAICIEISDGKTGYIPLVTDGIRASKINIQGDDGVVYKLALQKKNLFEEIAYCKMKIDLNNVIALDGTAYPGTYGTDFIQASLINKYGIVRVSATPIFYNAKNEDITASFYYNEMPIAAIFSVNVYLSNYGTGNTYEFNKSYSKELISSGYSYYNKDFNVTYNLSPENYYDSRGLVVQVSTKNSNGSITGKMTFNSLTINGKQIPVYC